MAAKFNVYMRVALGSTLGQQDKDLNAKPNLATAGQVRLIENSNLSLDVG